MLERFVDTYAEDFRWGRVPNLGDPSLVENNVLSGLSFDAFAGFYKKAEAHASIDRALSLDDQDRATGKWRELFGDRFPKPPTRKATGLIESATVGGGLTFPDRPVRPPRKPEGFA